MTICIHSQCNLNYILSLFFPQTYFILCSTTKKGLTKFLYEEQITFCKCLPPSVQNLLSFYLQCLSLFNITDLWPSYQKFWCRFSYLTRWLWGLYLWIGYEYLQIITGLLLIIFLSSWMFCSLCIIETSLSHSYFSFFISTSTYYAGCFVFELAIYKIIKLVKCGIWVSHSSVDEDLSFQQYDTMWISK